MSPSVWLADVARQSTVFRGTPVQVIPNGLDGALFSPGDRDEARRQLDLPSSERVLLAGAVGTVRDERKGFALLVDALRKCATSNVTRGWRLLVFGGTGPGQESLGIPVSYLGNISDERRLPAFYRAADLYALPSLQDNLPNTVVESLACGTPVVGFRTSGIATIVDGRTGRLAEPFSSESLASAITDGMSFSENRDWRAQSRRQFRAAVRVAGPCPELFAPL